jgi:putative ABC transport system permease protein
VAVLSFSTWNRLFGADHNIIGHPIELNSEIYRVVGVMPATFRWPTEADLWVPLGLPSEAFSPANRFNESYTVVARLRAGASLASASSFMRLLSKRAADSNPQNGTFIRSAEWSMVVEPFTQLIAGDLQRPMLILLAAVGFVLLIACSNIAGLMLVRATGRARELAIRSSLGATRAHLIKQAFTESVILSFAGTALGIFLASTILRSLISLAPREITSGAVI